jgi:hypothetical protein
MKIAQRCIAGEEEDLGDWQSALRTAEWFLRSRQVNVSVARFTGSLNLRIALPSPDKSGLGYFQASASAD